MKLFFVVFCALVIMVPFNAGAKEETNDIVPAGILPTNVLYVFDMLVERVKEVFTFSPEKKAQLHERLALERLSEISALEAKNTLNTKRIDQIKTKLEKHQAAAEKFLGKAKEKGKEVGEVSNTIINQFQKSKAKIKQIQETLDKRLETAE